MLRGMRYGLLMTQENGRLAAAAYRGHYRTDGGDPRVEYPVYYSPVRWTEMDSDAPPSGGRRGLIQ